MKILKPEQIKRVDTYTIIHEPIDPINLMERAALKVFNWICHRFRNKKFVVLVGAGNNGGDGLAVVRMLLDVKKDVDVFVLKDSDSLSPDCQLNYKRLQENGFTLHPMDKELLSRKLENDNCVVVDALFGTGLNRPILGLAADVIKIVNRNSNCVVAIDTPSGLLSEGVGNNEDAIVEADYTLSFQLPKLAYLQPDNELYVGEWHILNINLSQKGIEEEHSSNYYVSHQRIKEIHKKRKKFSHKGNYGHALIIAGAYGKMGAAILAARGCLRAGVGLLTIQIPHWGYSIIQTAVPEAMVSIDRSEMMFTEYPELSPYNVIGVGPGIGTKSNTVEVFELLLKNAKQKKMVIDADALNILSQKKELLAYLPVDSILTPHPKEFERLVGGWSNDSEKLEKLKAFCNKNKVVCVLKGAHTVTCLPNGECYFNSTGNPGMATAGSGDVLTGILVALLAQGYSSKEAAILGVYLHGLSGDMATQNISMEGIIADDIIFYLGRSFSLI